MFKKFAKFVLETMDAYDEMMERYRELKKEYPYAD